MKCPHSNICTVFEIDEEEGKSFIVMEYVEGKSLKETVQGIDTAAWVGENLARRKIV